MTARVSALMSVYNGEAYLAEALDSMLAELEPGDELIVVDDGSTDGTSAALQRYSSRVMIITQDNRGLAAGLNRAMAAASGEFVAFNDADDLWEPGRISKLLAALESEAAPDLAFGMAFQFVSPELSDEERRRFAPPAQLMRGDGFASLMTRASTFHRVGSLDESMRATAVYDWMGRAKAMGLSSSMLPDIVRRRRLHPANWSRKNREQLEAESLKALRSQILRHRSKGGTRPG